MDAGEKPGQAARRETMEEIGYDLGKNALRLIYTNDTYAPRFRFYTFACITGSEFEPKLNWESMAYMWTTVDLLPNPLHWGVEQLFNHDRSAKILRRFMKDVRPITVDGP